MKMFKSVVTCAKVSLFFLNLYVVAVVLVVVTGQWRIFETNDLKRDYDYSHLRVMRELQEDPQKKTVAVPVMPVQKVVEKQELKFIPREPPKKQPVVGNERSNRVHALQRWCQKLRPNLPDVSLIPAQKLQFILVDDKYKLLFCQIPGVALNDWRRILLYLSGKIKVKHHLSISSSDVHGKYGNSLKKLSEFSAVERKKRLEKYFKVMFVREPFERLVSSYHDKFAAKWSKYFHQTFGRKIIQKYRKKPSAASLKSGNDVKFAEFVQYVVDTGRQDEPMNEHWEQYYKQCLPCVVSYNLIGKYEMQTKDIQDVLKEIKAEDKIKPPLVSTNHTYSASTLKTLYKTVPIPYLQKLWKLLYPDYNLFSYEYPQVLKELLEPSKVFNDY